VRRECWFYSFAPRNGMALNATSCVQKTPEYFMNDRQMTTFGQDQLREHAQEKLARGNP
jgi:hypothetical protein